MGRMGRMGRMGEGRTVHELKIRKGKAAALAVTVENAVEVFAGDPELGGSLGLSEQLVLAFPAVTRHNHARVMDHFSGSARKK